MNKNLLPSIDELTMVLGEENRETAEDAFYWMARQASENIDETIDPNERWEIQISIGKITAFYNLYDKSTKEKRQLLGWYYFPTTMTTEKANYKTNE